MDPAIEKEMAAVREEIESLRAETRAGQTAGAPPPAAEGASGDQGDEPKAWADDLKELIAAMQGAVEATGKSVAVHPVAGVAAAFAVGVLIGRLTKIG
ncbi:MAG: hypothetical protein ABR878_00705 [Roseiarcus sp.]|jgi:ElaB/YqjD/DUF883 family membrane-anchored ribosome-binding protein